MKILFSIYAALMLAGGVMGYVKAQSKMSLIMGIISGIVISLGVYLIKNSPRAGYAVIAGMSGLLAVSFLMRFLKTQAFMPSGMLLGLSVVMLIVAVVQMGKKG